MEKEYAFDLKEKTIEFIVETIEIRISQANDLMTSAYDDIGKINAGELLGVYDGLNYIAAGDLTAILYDKIDKASNIISQGNDILNQNFKNYRKDL